MSTSPHDALFKAVLGQPEHARGALRAVMPVAVSDALDWPSLATCPGSFIDPALRPRHSDLLFSVAWRDGGDALIYVLFEHQSTVDDHMAFRILRYLVRIWERWVADHPRAATLPVIVPVTLYHGDEPWTAPRSFESLFDVPAAVQAALAPHLVHFRYLLDDLSEIADDVLRTRAMTALGRLAEACFKHARSNEHLLDTLAVWADVVRDAILAPHGREAVGLVMQYILLVNNHVEPEALQAFLERVASPEAKDIVMTAGERLIQQGWQEGRQEGRQEGECMLLLRLLRKRFGNAVDAAVEQRVTAASSAQLEAWGDRVLSAATLAELFAD